MKNVLLRFSGVLVGPTLHNWFGFLFSRFPAPGFKSTVQKIACDQLIFAPIFNPVFLLFVFGLEGRLSELPKVLEETWLEMTMKNWYLWVSYRWCEPTPDCR